MSSFRDSLPVRLLYTQNPFYLISAALVLLGVSQGIASMPGDVAAARAGAVALASYAALLAVVGVLLVRLGSVWDDARSILLVILLILAGLSVCFDELAMHSPLAAAPWLAGGLAFSLLLTEAVIRGIGLPWGPLWRVPFALLLTTLFAAPLAVSPSWLGEQTAVWRVLLFPLAGAAALLSLIPAVWHGRAQAERADIPWRWPLYPWTVFGFLALCLGGRSYLLSLSFVVDDGMQTAFAPYFLIPLALAVLVLVLESGISQRRSGQVTAVLLFAPATLLLTAVPSSSAALVFWDQVSAAVGNPRWLASFLLTMFYTYAVARGAGEAQWGLSGSLLAAAAFGDARSGELMLLGPATPLILLGAIQLVGSAQHRSSLRCLFGLAAWAAATAVIAQLPLLALLGSLLAALLLAGLLFDDVWSRQMRRVSAVLLAVIPWAAFLAAAAPGTVKQQALLEVGGLLGGCVSVSLAAWLWRRERWWLLAVESAGMAVLAAVVASGHAPLRSSFGARGARWLELGLASLVVGVLISITKATSWQRFWLWARAHFVNG